MCQWSFIKITAETDFVLDFYCKCSTLVYLNDCKYGYLVLDGLIWCSFAPQSLFSLSLSHYCHVCVSPQDLEGKIIVDELRQEVITTNSKAEPPQCTSLAWSADGQVSDSQSPVCVCV